MLEYLIDLKTALKSPLTLFAVVILLTLVAIAISIALFYDYSSVLSCAFLTLFLTPLFLKLFEWEEVRIAHEKSGLLSRHAPALRIYCTSFLATIVAYYFTFVFSPQAIRDYLFAKQLSEIRRIASISTGSFVSFDLARIIFANNTLVLLTTFLMSFLFGSGAIFILTWNASIIATYAGLAALAGKKELLQLTLALSKSLASIALHGIPELLGYFFAGLAGGILGASARVKASDLAAKKAILLDSLTLLAVGEFSIFVGAFIESGVAIFSLIAFVAYMTFILTFMAAQRK